MSRRWRSPSSSSPEWPHACDTKCDRPKLRQRRSNSRDPWKLDREVRRFHSRLASPLSQSQHHRDRLVRRCKLFCGNWWEFYIDNFDNLSYDSCDSLIKRLIQISSENPFRSFFSLCASQKSFAEITQIENSCIVSAWMSFFTDLKLSSTNMSEFDISISQLKNQLTNSWWSENPNL